MIKVARIAKVFLRDDSGDDDTARGFSIGKRVFERIIRSSTCAQYQCHNSMALKPINHLPFLEPNAINICYHCYPYNKEIITICINMGVYLKLTVISIVKKEQYQL